MSDDIPEPSSCLHNLYVEPIRKGAEPEATDLCASPLGMVHMLDCPLGCGLACTYYEPADGDRELIDDDELVRRRGELHRDYLRWSYRRRVRALRQEKGSLDGPIAVEPVPEPEEEPGADLDFSSNADAVPEDEAPVEVPEEQPEERYPGQRRSEDRRAPRPARSTPDPQEAPEEEDDEELAAITPADEGPRSIDELFATLPEAHLPDEAEQKKRAGRGGRSGRGGRGRRRSGGGPGRGRRKSGETPGSDGEKSGSAKSGEGGGGSGGSGRRRRRRRSGKPAASGDSPPKDGGQQGSSSGSRRRRRRRRKPKDGDSPSS